MNMKIYNDKQKLIIRDELLNEPAIYKLFITITSEEDHDVM